MTLHFTALQYVGRKMGGHQTTNLLITPLRTYARPASSGACPHSHPPPPSSPPPPVAHAIREQGNTRTFLERSIYHDCHQSRCSGRGGRRVNHAKIKQKKNTRERVSPWLAARGSPRRTWCPLDAHHKIDQKRTHRVNFGMHARPTTHLFL